MAKTIKIIIDEGGQLTTDFNGFEGEECFEEAAQLKTLLASLGVEIDIRGMKAKSGIAITETASVKRRK